MSTLCHKSVKKIAREIAGAAYESLAKDNVFYKAYPNQRAFINQFWGSFVGQARKSLVTMLDGNYPAMMKEEIFDIYVKDRTIQQVNAQQTMPAVQGTA